MADSEAQASDLNLISRVKQDADDAALLELMERHSGIFHQTVSKYLPPSLSNSEKEDVFEEKPSFFFEAINSYDESRNVKFVTWLANSTKYKLLSKRSEEVARPLFCEFKEDHGGKTDLSPDVYVEAKSESDEILQLVFDKYGMEMYDIFKQKYYGGESKTGKTFNEIAQSMGVSPQAIQAKHKTALKFLKRKLK